MGQCFCTYWIWLERFTMSVGTGTTLDEIREYLRSKSIAPLFVAGDCTDVLKGFPADSVDVCMTSPPYWGQRKYNGGGMGLERDYREYVSKLTNVCRDLFRVLKPTGSLWLNIGDAYQNKNLAGVPWRVALALTDQQGWTLRNSVIWHKVKGGPDNARDKLRNVHEHVFHFVKSPKDYYYNVDAIRSKPGAARVVNGSIVSATGVSGVRYKRQIELSTALTDAERQDALQALDGMLEQVRTGKLADFRMIIRGQQRTTHSDSAEVSGRARDLQEKGFYFLKYHPKGSKPSDVWEILPEDTQKRKGHFAAYPEDLCKIPVLATCPEDGVVLDPFCGTGTTMLVAYQLGRKSVGIDISPDYLKMARDRCRILL